SPNYLSDTCNKREIKRLRAKAGLRSVRLRALGLVEVCSARILGAAQTHLRAGRRRELQAVFLPSLNHARNVLLLLRTERADFLKEGFEARRRDDTHEAARRLAKVAVSVRYPARCENRRALLGDERFPANRPLVFTFEDLKRLVLAMMNVWRRAATGHVVRLNRADHATRVVTVDANDHRNAQDA